MQGNAFKLNASKTKFLVMGTARRLNNMVEDLVVNMEGASWRRTMKSMQSY